MAISANAIVSDPNEAWEYLEATEEERIVHADVMQAWLNGTTVFLERLCNRKLKAREHVEVQDGNGKTYMYLHNFPVVSISSFQVLTTDLATTYTISAPFRYVNLKSGRVHLLSGAETGSFLRGMDNIRITYIAGFDGEELEPLKDAVKELILLKWRERGEHPLDMVTSQSIGANVSITKFDPRRLPHIVQQVADMYRKWEV